jgi:hydroxymethylbilane synthase
LEETNPMATLRLGTRGSDLARWQAEHVAGLLRAARPDIEIGIVVITTTGDRILDAPLAKIGGKGLFTKEIEEALLTHRIDLAVHSLKDLPTILPDGLALAAVLSRTDPRDVWIAASGSKLADAPSGARIGTSSLRRQAQLLHARPDFRVETLRGNVPTRLKRALEGDLDAVVLARAGVERLGFLAHVTEVLSIDAMLPAPGQGALGIETRSEDAGVRALLESLEDPVARVATAAERAFLQALGGGCQVPVGALARSLGDGSSTLRLEGMVAAPSGARLLRGSLTGPAESAGRIGEELAARLVGEGAGEILAALRGPEIEPGAAS